MTPAAVANPSRRPKIDGKMACKYTLVHDLEQRLSGTFIRYKDKLVFVGGIKTNGNIILFNPVSLQELTVVKPDNPDLDISSLELGYFNFSSERHKIPMTAFYVARWPYKRYRQGVCGNNVQIFSLNGNNVNGLYRCDNGQFILHHQGFEDSVNGVFPSLKEAMELEADSVAISQDIAISKTKSGVTIVYYKMREAGWIAPNSQTINIPDNHLTSLLKSFFEDEGYNVEIN